MIKPSESELNSASLEISQALKDKVQKSQSWTARDFFQEKHFDWYFPNLAPNPNIDITLNYKAPDTAKGILYDQELVKSLIDDQDYRENYLLLTKKFFTSTKLLKEDDSIGDSQEIEFDEIRGYLVRTNKIIQSYRILMEFSKNSADEEIQKFHQNLQEVYKKVYTAFKQNEKEFNLTVTPDQSGLTSIRDCFEKDLNNMKFDKDSEKNKKLIALTSSRDIATAFNGNNLTHIDIEEKVDYEINAKSDSVGVTVTASIDNHEIKQDNFRNNLIGLMGGGSLGAGASLLCVSGLGIGIVSIPAIAIIATSVLVGAGIGFAIARNYSSRPTSTIIRTHSTELNKIDEKSPILI